MSLTRRSFLKYSAGAAGALLLPPTGCATAETSESTSLLVNHVGYTPAGAKFCLLRGPTNPTAFEVVATAAGTKIVHRGEMRPFKGDLGTYVVGDFSELRESGSFELRAAGQRSDAFSIADDVYDSAIQKSISYFAKQRCGDSKTGYHAPCHLDDGRRLDNGKHHDVTGGWHDACDLRKWVNATIYGMVGLTRLLDLLPKSWDRAPILEELRWGNAYFRKMQSPDGYLMNYCGGDDGNHWTDNRIGTQDDRPVHVEPCELQSQFQFVASQAALSRHVRDLDADYAKSCIDAARRCLTWCTEKRSPGAALSLGAGLLACVEMNRAAPDARFRDLAAELAGRLLSLQVGGAGADPASPAGFFRTAPDRPGPLRDSMDGNLPLLGLCEAITHFADHPDAPRWRGALELHARFLLAMSERSAFGTIPYGLYEGGDPGGDRRIGPYWYRWFMKRRGETGSADSDWWVGVNAHLASNGIGLVKSARILGEPRLAPAGARQLDWILGVNSFNSSTVSDVGRNQPRLYRTSAFSPNTPLIAGGVMNGLGGTDSDEPDIAPGSYNTCEYWTPMVCYTLWLMAEMRRSDETTR